MANKKMLPREIKLKEQLSNLMANYEELFKKLESKTINHNKEREDLIKIIQEGNQINRLLHQKMTRMQEEISDLRDFKQFARYALPHLQEKREMMAVNAVARLEDTQEH